MHVGRKTLDKDQNKRVTYCVNKEGFEVLGLGTQLLRPGDLSFQDFVDRIHVVQVWSVREKQLSPSSEQSLQRNATQLKTRLRQQGELFSQKEFPQQEFLLTSCGAGVTSEDNSNLTRNMLSNSLFEIHSHQPISNAGKKSKSASNFLSQITEHNYCNLPCKMISKLHQLLYQLLNKKQCDYLKRQHIWQKKTDRLETTHTFLLSTGPIFRIRLFSTNWCLCKYRQVTYTLSSLLSLNMPLPLQTGKLLTNLQATNNSTVFTRGFLWSVYPATVASLRPWTAGPAQKSYCQCRGCTARCCCWTSAVASTLAATGSATSSTAPPACCWTGWGGRRTETERREEKLQVSCVFRVCVCACVFNPVAPTFP